MNNDASTPLSSGSNLGTIPKNQPPGVSTRTNDSHSNAFSEVEPGRHLPPFSNVGGNNRNFPSLDRTTAPTLGRPPIGRLSPLPNGGGGSNGVLERGDVPRIDRSSPSPRVPSTTAKGHVTYGNENTGGNGSASGIHSAPQMIGFGSSQPLYRSTSFKKRVDDAGITSARLHNATPSLGDRPAEDFRNPQPVSDTVEELCPLKTKKDPVERFFVECHAMAIARNPIEGVILDEDEVLFDRLAEYTDDDSFFSSGLSVIEEDPRRLQKDNLRGRALRSVYDTLNLRALTDGRMPQELEDHERKKTGWMYQVHQRAIALHHSSFFIFPPGMTARVVVYNLMHHWLTELLLIFIIIGYSIFTAAWARHTWPFLYKPWFVVFADVFYTVLYGVEILARLFASGCILHTRAYFRSSWHCLDTTIFVLMILNCTGWTSLWNFTAFRLIRVIKSCTYIPMPLRMKLLAKSFLRSTKKLFHVSIIVLYALFFFALLGLQLFRGMLHHRCVSVLTGISSTLLCRPDAVANSGIAWGYSCPETYRCVADVSPNPHYGFRSFDDVGHALLSTFQIMTFQGWTNLLQETNDTMATVAILYYAFTILFCAWFIPSLYIGVFIEKIEITSRLFMEKQLKLFDSMLLEQRQSLNEAVKLRDFVERDQDGKLRRHMFVTTDSENYEQRKHEREREEQYYPGKNGAPRDLPMYSTEYEDLTIFDVKKRTKWTDEQRVQLHLSLTRQRDIAEKANRKRCVVIKPGDDSNKDINAHDTSVRKEFRPTSSGAGATGGDFSLGGRVGMVQHHPLSHTIGAARGSNLPLAVRLENEQERLKFLKEYQNISEDLSVVGSIDVDNGPMMRGSEGINVSSSLTRPPLHTPSRRTESNHLDEVIGGIIAIRESPGVIPSRRAGCSSGFSTKNASPVTAHNSNTPLHEVQEGGEVQQQPRKKEKGEEEDEEVLIHDPEGGDFRYAKTAGQRLAIVRNILHMFTEGYPRILTQYLWEHQQMQRRFGLMPLKYVNKYEEAAVRKLRQRAAFCGRRFHLNKELGDNNEDGGGGNEMAYVLENGKWVKDKQVEKLSPIHMAKNIVENAPITIFSGIMFFLMFANALFNASRHYGQPVLWDGGLFALGVCFTALFMLEILIRALALGPGPFFMDFFNVLSFLVTVIGFFELGFGQSNVITVLNCLRFLQLFRAAPFTPMRRVTRVLIHGFQDIVYALFFFSIYMFMWVLIGMSFFGSRTGWLDRADDDYYTRGNFDTFSHATFAVSQAFSYDRDEWVYLSWDGMRARGGYTVMYFVAVVGVAFIFRYLFISIFTWAWQCEEEREEYALQVDGDGTIGAHNRAGPRLRWFDFTVWRSFKHIHGGFERRDVAPDEVFYLNQDMRRQLRISEAKERFSRQGISNCKYLTDPQRTSCSVNTSGTGVTYGEVALAAPPVVAPQFFSVGGKLQRQMSMQNVFSETQTPPINAPISQFQAENAQLRFARHYTTVPATVYSVDEQEDHTGARLIPFSSASGDAGIHTSVDSNNAISSKFDDVYNHAKGELMASVEKPSKSHDNLTRRSSVIGRFPQLDYERSSAPQNVSVKENSSSFLRRVTRENEEEHDRIDNAVGGGVVYEHILLPGPRLRYKHVTAGPRRRVFERCLDCNTYKQMPLRAPPNVQQRTSDKLHAEHCHMAAVRSSRQLVMNAITGYVRLQKELDIQPTREAVETVLGQAWSCGMLLFETIEYLTCADVEELEYRTWDRLLEALQLQQWLIGLHVGEEQVGRATLAYILAHKQTQERVETQREFKHSWKKRSLFIFSPSHPVRRKVTSVVDSMWFEIFILVVIFLASIFLCFYTPGESTLSNTTNTVLFVFDCIFCLIFVVEMLLKWISMGVVFDMPEAYFWHRWNVVDCFITIVSVIGLVPGYERFRCLKALRCFRIFGPLQYCTFNDSIAKLALVMWNCVPTLANVLLFCLLNYFVWAILAVRLFMGVTHSCTDVNIVNQKLCLDASKEWVRSKRNFDNIFESLLTMFEVSTGSKWFDVIYAGVDGQSMNLAPVENFYPSKGFFFIAYYYISHLVLFSLFVASMIYCYLLVKNAAEGVVGITFEHQLWIRMQHMILRLSPRVRLIPLGNSVSRFFHRVVTYRYFEVVMACVLFSNLVTMSLYWYGNSPTQEMVLDIFQYIWVAFFTLEVFMKLGAHGIRSFSRWSFCFDTFLICLSYLQILLEVLTTTKIPFNVNVLRLLRLGRILKLVDLLPVQNHLRLLHEVLLLAAPSLVTVSVILFLALFVFAVLGMHLIGPVLPVVSGYIDEKYNNFLSFPNALMMMFRLSTMEDWVSMLRSSFRSEHLDGLGGREAGAWAPFFFALIVVCFTLMILSLYMAVVVDYYVAVVRMNASVTRLEDLRRFRDLWSAHDPNATLVLRTQKLPEILEALRPPLGISSRHNRVELLSLLQEYDIPDHEGMVHYYEVLLPLARRVLAMAFSEGEMDDGTTFESMWRLSEKSLRALPTVLVNQSSATTAQYFAASYVQAAYRRDKACIRAHRRRAYLLNEARTVCDELGLPYDAYGFGSYALGDNDPRLGASPHDIFTQSAGKREGRGVVPTLAETERSASQITRSDDVDGGSTNSALVTARLPGMYHSAIDDKKRFGPDAPNAVKRHEKRSEKILRKEKERLQQQQSQLDAPSSASQCTRSSSLHPPSSDQQPPLGTDPNSWLDAGFQQRTGANNVASGSGINNK